MCLCVRYACTHACADVHALVHVVCVAYACNKCENVSNICVMYVRVCICVCLYVCLYVCVRSCVLMGGVCACLHASMPAFTHASTDVYYMRTIHVRPYIYVAYDDYVLGPCRAANAGGPGSQGSALAAASSALRRLHSLQLFLM